MVCYNCGIVFDSRSRYWFHPRNTLRLKSCCVSGETTAVLFIINSWNLAKPLTHNAIIKKLSIWIMHWSKSDWNGPKDMAKWFCNTTMPCLTHLNWWKTPWNHLDGTFFYTRSILLTGAIWPSPLHINGTRACRTVFQQFRKSWKMAQQMVCRKRKTVSLAGYS